MADLTTLIDGYTVDLDTDMEGDGKVTGCWINYLDYSASLQCAQAMGFLTDSGEREHKMQQRTLDKIEKWAEENGY